MNTDSELVVISAAGTSRWTTIQPIILLALVASIVSFAVDNGVDPYARERSRQKIAAARADLLSLVIQEGTFRKIENGLFVQIGERLPDGNLGQIFVADSREKNVDLVYYAKTGSVVEQGGKSMLMMFDGVINRKTPDGDVSIIRFTSYAFDLAQFSNAAGRIIMYPKDRTISYLLNPDPNDPIFKKTPQYFRAELHRRFTEWLYPLVFALIAIAVVGDAQSLSRSSASIRSSRRSRSRSSGAGWAFSAWTGCKPSSGSSGWSMPSRSCRASISIWFIATNRTMELPLSWVERLAATFRRLGDAISQRWSRLIGSVSAAGGRA